MNKERYSLSMIEAMDQNTMRQILKNQEIECMRVDEAARRAAHMEEQARLAEEADKQFLTDFMKEKFRNQGVIIEE